MAYNSVLKINEESSSFNHSEYYHVGQRGIDATITCQPGYKIVTEAEQGDYNSVRVYVVKDN